MTLASQRKLSFTEFLAQCPEDGFYELVNGEIVRILATRHHEDIADFIADIFKAEVSRCQMNYKVSDRIVLATQTETGQEQGRHPDVSVVDQTLWRANRTAYTALREPIQLAVEVVSTNWEDDYEDKLDEYQRLGIPEYWIVDYLTLGSRAYLGFPKQPAIFVYQLDAQGHYQYQRYQEPDHIQSPTFPDLQLTLAQILTA